MKNYNTELPPAEYVAVDSYLRHQLMLADFPRGRKRLELAPYLVKTENVFPCVDCDRPVARLKVVGYVRVVDCFSNKSGARIAWQADVLSEHVCAGGGFQ